MKRKILFFIFMSTIMVEIGLIITTCSLENDKVELGAIIALSGSASNHVDVRDGMLLTVDEINKRGGINGRKISLVVRDSESDPKIGLKAFEDIEKQDRPIVYFSTLSTVSTAISPLAEKNKVVLMGLVVSAPDITKDKEWTYRFYPTSEDEANSALFLAKYLKVKRLGILYQDEVYGISIKEILEEKFREKGGIVAGEPFAVKNPDFSGAVERLMDVDAVCIIGYAGNMVPAIEKLRESGYTGKIIGTSGVAGLAETRPEINGVYIVTPSIYNEDYRYVMELKEKFESQYERELTHHVATGYEAIKLIAGLLEGKELSRENVRSVLEKGFVFPCVFGDIEVIPGENDAYVPLFPAYVKNNKIEYLQ
ncbi:MAG: amino acid ABC transporter substrate-binding protein [Deltaproteobacteria bacterium]|uniref:Amino acid ABC transporter substrate-binding protein n=1 Tax=Candidatus Zymogenus saltonus TaxID=2844893 RepID=A0A9D8KFC9_9DELT|nr:amino acid ABC transporter substrate-binding protein [Candidatus Zymogenus saltonus]